MPGRKEGAGAGVVTLSAGEREMKRTAGKER